MQLVIVIQIFPYVLENMPSW